MQFLNAESGPKKWKKHHCTALDLFGTWEVLHMFILVIFPDRS